MGPCQGGFCAYRVAALLHELRSIPIEDANVALRDFLQERWKGELSILWGQQLRQERLDELIYLSCSTPSTSPVHVPPTSDHRCMRSSHRRPP